MNNELMQILEIINNNLRGEVSYGNSNPGADSLCSNVVNLISQDCNNKGVYACEDCPIGYNDSNGHATQIIQTWRQL